MAKPKAKSTAPSKEGQQTELERMLTLGAITNHLTDASPISAPAVVRGSQVATPAPEAEPTAGNEEQKGENVSGAPAAETGAPAAPKSAAMHGPEPTASTLAPAPDPEPASTPGPEPEASAAPEPDQVAAAPNQESPSDIKDLRVFIPDLFPITKAGSFDLASLFVPPSEKKTAQMRLTNTHYQYLLLLGTIVGGGATPPDIVYNLVEQFIAKHDAQVQKAIAKQMRQRISKKH